MRGFPDEYKHAPQVAKIAGFGRRLGFVAE